MIRAQKKAEQQQQKAELRQQSSDETKNDKKREAQEESAWRCVILLMRVGTDPLVIIQMKSHIYYLFAFSKS